MSQERRRARRLCLSCKQLCKTVVRFKHAAPYCEPCGQQLARTYGWVILPSRRDRTFRTGR